MKDFDLRKYLAENKLLKEDRQPTHRINVDVYYVEDTGEAVPEYELGDYDLDVDDFEFTYIDVGMEGWYENGEFETIEGSNTRVEPEYVEEILSEGWKTQGHRKGWKTNPKPKENVFSVSLTNNDRDEELVVYVKGVGSEEEAIAKVKSSDKFQDYPDFTTHLKTYDLTNDELDPSEEEQFEGDLAFFDVESLD